MKKKLKTKGYALLFALVIVSAVSMIAAGLSSTSYKQLILSSLVRDSQVAFYNADMASECTLYFYLQVKDTPSESDTFVCGDYTLDILKNGNDYIFEPNENSYDSSDPCFRMEIQEDSNSITMTSDGYNICNTSNPRSVEREIEISFDI